MLLDYMVYQNQLYLIVIPRFTSLFWRSLWEQLGTKLHMSTAYHPQSDGQTERANRVLEEALRAYVSPLHDDWDEHLASIRVC